MSEATYNVTTWADGFGRWHASVPLTGFPTADANAARKAIRAEIDARGVSSAYRLRVTRECVTSHGTAKYGEV